MNLEYLKLGPEWLGQISWIEERSFPCPWSKSLLEAEFGKDYSLSRGLVCGEQLLAYSFSHFLVDDIHLLTLAVHPKFRGEGIGAELLNGLIAESRSIGAIRVTLEVRRGNSSAISLYEKTGFKRVSICRGYYSNNGEDAVIYQLELVKPEIAPVGNRHTASVSFAK